MLGSLDIGLMHGVALIKHQRCGFYKSQSAVA